MLKSIRLGIFWRIVPARSVAERVRREKSSLPQPICERGRNMFSNYELSVMFIVAQVVGFIATGISIASFQAKKRINMLIMQTVSNFLWMTHYFMLGSLPATFAFLIASTRNVVYGLRGKYKFADSKAVPALYIVAFIISGVITYETPLDILPTLGMVCASIAFFVKEEKLIRYISVLIALSFFSFGIYQGSIASIFAEGSTLASIIIAMIRYGGFEKYEKETPRFVEDDRETLSESEEVSELQVE